MVQPKSIGLDDFIPKNASNEQELRRKRTMNTVEIDGKTKLLGLLGNPVEHSVSPILHASLARLRQDNYAYLAFKVEEEELKAAVDGAYALGANGLNVTVPHKKNVIPYLHGIDRTAEVIGAVNTLVRVEGGFKGYNTDMPGLFRAMEYDGVCLENANVVVIGAGGVANAVLGMLFDHKVENVLVLNRTKEKAVTLIERFTQYFGSEHTKVCVASYEEDYLKIMDEIAEKSGKHQWIAIQATSVGMSPNVEQAAIENVDFYKKVGIGYDLIFNPYETRFMKLIKEQGGESYNGLRMLLFQGIYAYELWNDTKIPNEWAEVVLEDMKKALLQ